MSVNSSTFGAVRLTNKDARKFQDQVTYGRVKKAAVDSCARGKNSAAEYVTKGFAALKRFANKEPNDENWN
jgi:hypothetical protein